MKNTNQKINFSSFREKIVDANYKVASFFGRNRTAAIITILFVVFDAVSLYMLLNLVFPPTAELAMYSTIFSLALCLDVPLGLAGTEVKKAMQKLVSWKYAIRILAIASVGFLLVFAPFAMFRMETRDLSFQMESGTGLVSMVGDVSEESAEPEQEEDDVTLSGGLLLSLMPLVTSISSFLINLLFADPLGDRLFDLDKQKARIENMRLKLRAAIAEAGNPDQYEKKMFDLEAGRYDAMNQKLNTQRVVLKEVFDLIMMEYLANPESISNIEDHAQKTLQKHQLDRSLVKNNRINTDNNLIAA